MKRRILFSFIFLLLPPSAIIMAQSDTLFNQTDARGLKQGYWKKCYPNGFLMYKGYFRNGKPAGELQRYYESGALKVIMTFTGRNDACHAVLYYENGQPAARGNYTGTAKDSTWEYLSYYDQSVKSRETYFSGKKNGPAFHYYPDGTVSEKTDWKDGMKNGTWERYYPNARVMSKGSYIDDKLSGSFYVFTENGRLSVQGYFLENRKHDRWVFYKDDGTVDIEIRYNNGQPEDEEKLSERQREMMKMIDENQGKYAEPDESDFLEKGDR